MGPLPTYLFGAVPYKVYHCLFVLSDLCWCHLASSLSANCLQVWGAICSRDGLGSLWDPTQSIAGPVFSAGSFGWSCVEFCGWTSQHNLTRRVGVVFFLGRKVYDLKTYMFFSAIFGWLDGKHVLKFTQQWKIRNPTAGGCDLFPGIFSSHTWVAVWLSNIPIVFSFLGYSCSYYIYGFEHILRLKIQQTTQAPWKSP